MNAPQDLHKPLYSAASASCNDKEASMKPAAHVTEATNPLNVGTKKNRVASQKDALSKELG
jgi:hypothetical protein